MSFTYVCDYCGQPIEENDTRCTLAAEYETLRDQTFSDREALRRKGGWVGHYHQDGPDCWRTVRDYIRMIHEFGPSIEGVPTITGQALAARRRKMRRVDSGRAEE